MIYAIHIINKAGGLAYNRDFATSPLTRLSSNDYLIFAGTFHGIHAITSKISPVPQSSGIELIETEAFTLRCFQTQTGLKFLLVTDPAHIGGDADVRKVYECYADYATKNPFFTPEMPIRCDKFDQALLRLVSPGA